MDIKHSENPSETSETLQENGQETPTETALNSPENSGQDNILNTEILNLYRQGLSIRKVAKQLNLKPGRVYRVVKGTRDDLNALSREQIAQKIYALASVSVETVDKLRRTGKKEDIRLKAAIDLLDRAGFAPVQKQLNVSIVEEMSREQLLQGIKSLASAINRESIDMGTGFPADKVGADDDKAGQAGLDDRRQTEGEAWAQSRAGGVAPEKISGGTHADNFDEKTILHPQEPQETDKTSGI